MTRLYYVHEVNNEVTIYKENDGNFDYDWYYDVYHLYHQNTPVEEIVEVSERIQDLDKEGVFIIAWSDTHLIEAIKILTTEEIKIKLTKHLKDYPTLELKNE